VSVLCDDRHEIDVLRARLEEENLYLREEVTAALGMGDFVGESPAAHDCQPVLSGESLHALPPDYLWNKCTGYGYSSKESAKERRRLGVE
jgi:hypothetical protein